MSRSILVCTFMLSWMWVVAQPLTSNAAWNYCYSVMLENPIPYEDLMLTSGESYELYGKDCMRVIISGPSTLRTRDSIVLCQDDDRVYYQEEDSLYLLYDFSLTAGDTLQVRFPLEFDTSYVVEQPGDEISFDLKIDSVGSDLLGGVSVRKQYISVLNANPWVHFGSFIRERTGFEYWLLPYFGYEALDGDGIGGLSRYADQEINVGFDEVCMTTSIFEDKHSAIDVLVYPNPFRDFLQVETAIKPHRADLFSGTGSLLGSAEMADGTLNFSHLDLQSGLYLIRLYSKEGAAVIKVMKQ